MKHLFIINPAAGGNKNGYSDRVSKIRRYMGNLGEKYEIYVSKSREECAKKIRAEADAEEKLRIYACGGDGTLNECANVIAGMHHVAITHIPCGTGNDFIRAFGENKELFSDLDALVHGDVHAIDMIDCNGRLSLNICSTGFDARVARDVHKYSHLPVIGGSFGYVISALANLLKGINEKMTVTVGGKTISGEFALACCCNGRYYGGGFNPMPDSLLDDGIMNSIIVRRVSVFQFITMIGRYSKGRARELSHMAVMDDGTEVIIESDHEQTINVDGELMTAKKTVFRLLPGKLNFIVPRGAKNLPLLRKN